MRCSGAEICPAKTAELCDLLERAGVNATSKAAPPGGSLPGGADPSQRDAAEQIVRRFLRYEEEIESLCGEVLERYEEATLVYRLCERLGDVLGEEPIARLVLEDAARVLGARSGEVWLRNEASAYRAAACPEGGPAGPPEWDRAAQAALDGGRPWVVEATGSEESVLAVPLLSNERRPFGTIVLRGRSEGRSYRTGEIKLLMALASLTSAFIRNARLAEEVRGAEARKREDEIARVIHRRLLPREDPRFEGIEIAGGHRAAENVGGDYYGYVVLPDGGLGLAMADVAGHGVPAALYMAAAKGVLQSEARRTISPADLLRRTNEVLAADFSESDVFATTFFARFHPGGREFDYSNGGHNPPLLIHAGGKVELLERGGPALGMWSGLCYVEESKGFEPGDVLAVYTDGLVEARDPDRRPFGMERLVEVVVESRGEEVATIHDRVLREFTAHCGSMPPADDVTLVIAKGVDRAAERRSGG